MLALDLYEVKVCPGCGFHDSVTGDPENLIIPEHHVCPVCAGRAQYERVVTQRDEEARALVSKDAPPHTPQPADGRSIIMRQLSPAEADRERERRRKGGGSRGHTPGEGRT